MDKNSTHLPMLWWAIEATQQDRWWNRGAILELGCGWYSTPVLEQIHLMQDREVVSFDDSEDWVETFKNRFSHQIYLTDWKDVNYQNALDRGWSVVLVDHSPAEQRAPDLWELRNNAKYIVVHDTEDSSYGYDSVLDEFKYKYTYQKYEPWTTVVSNFRPVPTHF